MSSQPLFGSEPRTIVAVRPARGQAETVIPAPASSATSFFDSSDSPTAFGPASDAVVELRPPLVPGDLGACGGHRVLRVLGRGGMGAVFEALDTALNRRVALKLMLPNLAASEQGRARFLREARAAAAVRHENVVSVYAVGEDAGTPFLTMELLRGEHLGHALARGLPLADAIRIAREVALGLEAAHQLGLVHRDIKPANIWIEAPSGRARLLDFGLARLTDDVSTVTRGGPAGAPGLTECGELIGTPMYMAPEQVNGELADARTDLFALGAVLYQMVTGAPPFAGLTLRDLAAAVLSGACPSVAELVPAAPPELCSLIHRSLAPDPADRPASAGAVAAELLAIGTGLLVSSGDARVALPVTFEPVPKFDFDREGLPQPRPRRRTAGPGRLLLGTGAALAGFLFVTGAVGRLAKPAPAPPPPAQAEVPKPAPKPAPKLAPMTPLFSGRDLAGWGAAPGGASSSWAVRDGVLVGTPMPGGDQALLTDKEYGDFELRVEYRWPKPGGHTVVLLRARAEAGAVDRGLAVNIGDDEGFPAVHGRVIGGLYRTGLVQGLTFNPSAVNRPIGQWNELLVLAKGTTIEVQVNKTPMPVADLSGMPSALRPGVTNPSGRVGLVCHWGQIEYRNVTLRPIIE